MRKHLFYLTNNRLSAYRWEGGALSGGPVFAQDEAGWEAFSLWLAGGPRWRAHLLVDLIEEDFQRDSVPHVLGRARAALLERRLNQYYRDTPYRRATPQGREKEGRKDDRILFSALTNVAQLKPWIDALLLHEVPLAGIHSVALLGARLPAKLGLGDGAVLLMLRHTGGLRQTFLQDGQLRFSRLTPLADRDPQSVAQAVMEEVAKIRQFLASTRQLFRDQPLQVAIAADAESLAALEAAGAAGYQLVQVDELAQLLRLSPPADAAHADAIYLSQVGAKAPAADYALPAASRFYRLWQTRIALNALSVAALAAALLWTGFNLLGAFNAASETRRLASETAALAQRQQAVLASMPKTDTNPHDMKLAVDLEELLARNAPSPLPLAGVLGRAIEAQPEIRLHRLHWRVGDPRAGADGAAVPAAPTTPAMGEQAPPPPVAMIGIPDAPPQEALVEGEVAPFDKNYRRALESVQRFAAALGADPRLKVEIAQAPLDIKPAAILSGEAGREDAEAKASFTLKLSWKP